jgi:hypothetical protein
MAAIIVAESALTGRPVMRWFQGFEAGKMSQWLSGGAATGLGVDLGVGFGVGSDVGLGEARGTGRWLGAGVAPPVEGALAGPLLGAVAPVPEEAWASSAGDGPGPPPGWLEA